MMRRCYNENNGSFKYYGGRGIIVCDEWHDVKTFMHWAKNNGWKKKLELDRKDNNKNYSPDNCQFISDRDNKNNCRSNIIVNIFDEEMTFAEAHRKYGKVTYETARERYRYYGWNIMDSLQKPTHQQRRR